jgi:hypothetical protein
MFLSLYTHSIMKPTKHCLKEGRNTQKKKKKRKEGEKGKGGMGI